MCYRSRLQGKEPTELASVIIITIIIIIIIITIIIILCAV